MVKMKENKSSYGKINKKVYQELKSALEKKLLARGATDLRNVSDEHIYQATVTAQVSV